MLRNHGRSRRSSAPFQATRNSQPSGPHFHMDTIKVEIAGELEHGKPLFLSCAIACIPLEAIEEHEIVYRVRQAPSFLRGDLLIVEPRTTASTGELVVAFRGANLYLG